MRPALKAVLFGKVRYLPSVNVNFLTTTALSSVFSSTISFARTGNAMMYDATGKLTYAPNNLLTYSNTLTNGIWSATGTGPTITAGMADPVGGTNATKLAFTNGVGGGIYNATLFSGNHTLLTTVWLRADSAGTFNVLTQQGGSGGTVNVTTSWQQFYFNSSPAANNGIFLQYYPAQDTLSTVYVYAPTASAVTYETTPRPADQVITTSAAYYGPRLDYDPATLAAKGLLIEEARTNMVTASADFSSAWTHALVTVTPASGTAPDGTNTLSKLSATVSGSQYLQCFQIGKTFTNGATYTASAYFKSGEITWGVLNLYDTVSGNRLVWFDLSTGTVGTVSTGLTATITNVGGGIYRCSISGAVAFTSGGMSVEMAKTNGLDVANYTAGEGLYAWGAQLEPGSFPTSYIPTAAAAVTRAADMVQLTGSALALLQTLNFSVVAETANMQAADGNNVVPLAGNNNNEWLWYSFGNGSTYDGSYGVQLTTANAVTIANTSRLGLAGNGSGRSLVLNGGPIASDANPVGSAIVNCYLGSNAGANRWINGYIRSFALYNTKLPDAVLKSKSVVGSPL